MDSDRTYLKVEFTALFFVVPLLAAVGTWSLPLWGLLAAGGLAATGVLLADRTFDRGQLWNRGALRGGGAGVAALWVVGVFVLATIVRWGAPEAWLRLPRERPGLWVAICVLYPLLSVYPQNVIYRAFIFHRYRTVFEREWAMVWASAAAFAWGHIIFHNAVALALTLAGGLLFARTYQKHRSLLLVSVEHALYGLAAFTVGLGAYLYRG